MVSYQSKFDRVQAGTDVFTDLKPAVTVCLAAVMLMAVMFCAASRALAAAAGTWQRCATATGRTGYAATSAGRTGYAATAAGWTRYPTAASW